MARTNIEIMSKNADKKQSNDDKTVVQSTTKKASSKASTPKS